MEINLLKKIMYIPRSLISDLVSNQIDIAINVSVRYLDITHL